MSEANVGAGATALVIDDTEGNRYTVARLLKDAGMRVLEADTVADARRHLRSWTPDLVVVDINLPDGTGHDVCRHVKENPTTASVPVMHVSASFVTDADRAYGLEHGADAYLTHPLDPGVFIATARALLRAEGERGRMYQQEHLARQTAERTAARATLLQGLTSALANTMSAHDVSQVVVTRAFSALGALAGLLTVAVGDGKQQRLFGSANVADDVAAQWSKFTAASSTPANDAFQTGRAVMLNSPELIAGSYPELSREVFSLLQNQPHSLYAAPLVVDRGESQRVLGAILLLWSTDAAVTPETATLINAVADQCALALERARLYEAERNARAAAETARMEAEQANAAKMQFLAVMSHELRTPLNAIGGYTELIELGMYGPVTTEQAGALERIRRSQQHLLGLINSVLNYAKVEAGKIEYRIEQVNLAEIIRSVEALINPLTVARGLTLEAPICDESLTVRADTEKLRQILLNLLSNAIKFTPTGGTVRVTCEAALVNDRHHVNISVSDTGRGISAVELLQVFDPFVQVGRRLSSTEGGSGLGLAISRDLARGMGGDITASSELGVGSTFTVSLPVS